MDGDEPLVVNRPRLVKDFIDLGVHGAGSSFSTPRSSALAGGIGRSDEHSEARCSQSTKSLFDLPLQALYFRLVLSNEPVIKQCQVAGLYIHGQVKKT